MVLRFLAKAVADSDAVSLSTVSRIKALELSDIAYHSDRPNSEIEGNALSLSYATPQG